MTLDYLHIPVAILRLADLNLRQKLLLALVVSFNNKGLKMSNKAISNILNIRPDTISKLLADLEGKKYIEITNAQSRWRIIYFGENAKVGDILLWTESQSKRVLLWRKSQHTLEKSPNITKEVNAATAHKHTLPVCEKPPTEEEVRAYSTTQGVSDFDAKRFVEWYTAAEWRHKDGELMLNWKQTVLSWIRRDRAKEAARPEPKRGDPDWLPTEEEAEAIMKECGVL